MNGESNSITNQKKILEDYAEKNGYANLHHYTDDGWSGASFDRPNWKRLVEDVEQGRIGTVIVKDMSRVGRDYLQVGFYTEVMFREKAEGIGVDRKQEVEIFLNYIGRIEVPHEEAGLTEEEKAEQEKERIRLEKKRASNRKYMARKREEIRRQRETELAEKAI